MYWVWHGVLIKRTSKNKRKQLMCGPINFLFIVPLFTLIPIFYIIGMSSLFMDPFIVVLLPKWEKLLSQYLIRYVFSLVWILSWWVVLLPIVRKTLVAICTFVCFFHGVNLFMSSHVTLLRDTLVAIFTSVWFLLCMNPAITSLGTCLRKTLVAIVTSVWCFF